MVFFTCSHCGESVKKPSVAKHYQTKCRKNEPFLTCVDCLKDFKGNEYEAHTKCVTEDERYSAKGYVPKPSQNKGERKQQAWQECIQTVLKKPTLKPDERDLIQAISKYENVPRKKSKFVNFLSNALRQYANKTNLIDRVWTEMESVFKDMSNVNGQQNSQEEKPHEQETETPKTEENGVKKEKTRKRQADNENPDSGKSEEKIKKKKQKTNEENNTETSEIPPETEKKKNKKRKTEETGETTQKDSVPDETEPVKKKKKKKQEKTEEDIKEIPVETPETESPKKKKKNKKRKPEDETPEIPTEESEEVKKKEKKSENKENRGEEAESQTEGDKTTPKKKKSKGDVEEKTEKPGTFNWKTTILDVLNQNGKNNRIQLQKLQKKVLKLHCQMVKCENSGKKEKKFMKKLKEIPEIEINEEFVVLKS